jgi:hypothetical protein
MLRRPAARVVDLREGGKPRLEDSLFEGERAKAWRKGYEDCGTQDATPD